MTVSTDVESLYIAATSRSFITQIPLSALTVDPHLQRDVKESRVAKMVKDFDPDALGVLEVSQRTSGMNHVLDGRHRLEVMRSVRKAGGLPEDYTVSCKVFVGLAEEEEARLFILLNNKENVNAFSLFKLKIRAKDESALDIVRILEESKWKLGPGGKEGFFCAVSSIQSAYARNPISTEKAVRTLTRAWDHHPSTLGGDLIMGLSMFFNYYGNAASVTRLTTRLTDFRNRGRGLLTAGQNQRDVIGGTISNAVASLLPDLYNRNLSTQALPPWPRNGKRDRNAPPVLNTLSEK